MNDAFKNYHPIVNFTYFIGVILFGMLFMHPILIAMSFIIAISYNTYLIGLKSIIKTLMLFAPLIIFATLINAFFNHQGVTILFYFNNNPITMDSICYGLFSGLMFVSIIIWFNCYNQVFSSDKFIYLFGKKMPSISLIFSMILRLVPKIKLQIKAISNAQRCIGKGVLSGGIIDNLKHSIKIISILTSWVFENSIDTTYSMKSRGYGLKNRTNYSNFIFSNSDKKILAIMILLILSIIGGTVLQINEVIFFPYIKFQLINYKNILFFITYFLFLLIPMLINLKEEFKWKFLK